MRLTAGSPFDSGLGHSICSSMVFFLLFRFLRLTDTYFSDTLNENDITRDGQSQRAGWTYLTLLCIICTCDYNLLPCPVTCQTRVHIPGLNNDLRAQHADRTDYSGIPPFLLRLPPLNRSRSAITYIWFSLRFPKQPLSTSNSISLPSPEPLNHAEGSVASWITSAEGPVRLGVVPCVSP